MRRWFVAAAAAALAAGCECEEEDPADCRIQAEPWNGATARYTCPTPHGVDYGYVCDASGGYCNGVAHPDLGGCVAVTRPYPWPDPATLDPWLAGRVASCQSECSAEVDAEATALGRDVITDDCAGGVDEATYTLQNCTLDPMGAPQQRRLDLTWSPAWGGTVRSTGSIRYAVATSRSGVRTLRLSNLEVAGFALTTQTFDATVLLPFQGGTRLVVGDVALRPIDLTLDRYGSARIPAGHAVITSTVSVTEPGGRETRQVLTTTNPWELSVTWSSQTGLSFSVVTDPFGGTLTAR